MRRLCTDYEKNVLYNHRGDILPGAFEVKYGAGMLSAIIGILAGMVVSTPLVFGLNIKDEDSARIVILLFIAIGIIVFQIIFTRIGASRDKSNIFRNNQIEINGATVLGIDMQAGYFIYAEDDFYDGCGRIQRLSFPIAHDSAFAPGMRMLAVRASDGTYFLMRLSGETANLIPACSSVNLFDWNAANILSLSMIPHPNAYYADVYPRLLNQNEKERLFCGTGSIIEKDIRFRRRFFDVMCVVLSLCAFCILVGLEVVTEFVPAMLLLAGLLAFYVVFMLLLKRLFRKSVEKNLKRDVYVQRVILKSCAPNTLKVYEYTDGMMTEKSYDVNYNEKKPYGTVLYKYTQGKNIYFTSKTCG